MKINFSYKLAGVFAVLILSSILRFWGIDYGLPYDYLADESKHVRESLEIIISGDPNPHYFHKGSLYLYFLATIYIPYFLYGASQGVFTAVNDLLPNGVIWATNGELAFPTQFLVGRIAIAVLGILTIWFTYLVGKKCYNYRVGIIAAFFLAISPIHALTRSHGINADVPTTLLTIVSFFFAYDIIKNGNLKNYFLAGLFGGLAVSVKYNSFFTIIFLFSAYLLGGRFKEQLNRFTLCLIVFGFGFWIGTPYSLLDLPTFLNQIAQELFHYSNSHFGSEGNSLLWYAQLLFRLELAMPILAIGTVVYAILKPNRTDIFLIGFPICYFAIISSFTVHFARNLLPILPFIMISASRFLDVCITKLEDYFVLTPRKRLMIIFFFVVVSAGYPLYQTVLRNTWLAQREDIRTTSLIWINQNIPTGSSFWVEGYHPPLSVDKYSLHYRSFRAIDTPFEWFTDDNIDIDYVIFSPFVYERAFSNPEKYAIEVEKYQTMFQRLVLVKEIDGWMSGSSVRGKMKIYKVP